MAAEWGYDADFPPEFAEWMGGNRIDMAKETEASMIITACPWCDYNFRDSVKKDDNIEVKNIVDLLYECVADMEIDYERRILSESWIYCIKCING